MPFGEQRSSADRVSAFKARQREIERRPCKNTARRKRLEKDPVEWLRYYLAATFPLPFSRAHIAIVEGAIDAATTGTGIAVAAPRGEGKTTLLRGVSLYLVATGMCRFPLVCGWTHKASGEAFRLWLKMLHGNKAFRNDYPELTQPFEQSIHAAWLRNLKWKDSGEECGAEVRSVERCIVLPDSIGAIASASVQGDVKGLSVTLADGSVLRPDLLLVDDAQDPARAGNPAFVADVVDRIEKQWMCLAGPQSRITTMVACTVAAAGDVSEHFLSREDFKSVRVSRIETWPDGWAEKESETKRLWTQWRRTMLDGQAAGDGSKAARAFYKDNKDAMIKGMAVSWAERYDKKRKDPDAFYSAMYDYYRLGSKAFASEYQNKPEKRDFELYDLTPELVGRRINKLKRREVDASIKAIFAFSDINFAGMWWAIVGFRNDMTGYVLDYGKHPSNDVLVMRNATEAVKRKNVADGVYTLLQKFSEMRFMCGDKPMSIKAAGIDRGFLPDVVQGVLAAIRLQFPVMAVAGFAGHKYRSDIKSRIGEPRNQCHVSDSQYGNFLASNTDYFKEIVQRGFLDKPGTPGSLSFYDAPYSEHAEIAQHVCAERLTDKAEGMRGSFWKWSLIPGACNDGLDALTGCYSLQSWFMGNSVDLSAAGQQPQRRRVRKIVKLRKPKVSIEE